ncbi:MULTISPECIES: lasso peptide biosynthesis PqqD family chaperone [Amycolatopsis]|uniref:Lasso peptide biosynthesis PqqD family chaperone n=1 Tax=Amycolatopsis albidoflavus TaxID=102226 RepID=A0ABW5IGA5_9PSEU
MSLRLHTEVVTADTPEGTVLLQMNTGRYWQLNPTGAGILHRLLEGRTPTAIGRELADRHRIGADQAERDVTAVIGQLRSAGLVVPA